MEKILVTGGAGFLGSNLCKRLLLEGNEVVCMDNFSSGTMYNIHLLMRNNKFKLLEHDIIKPFDIKVDKIFNLACPASPSFYQKIPLQTAKTCVLGLLNVLELATKNHSILLQASTSEIYGNPERHPQDESYFGNVNTVGIRSCYDEGKRMAETLCYDYYLEYGTRIKIVRIFNTYGPNMSINDGRVIPNFIIQALLNKDIIIYGDGKQTRSFCYIDDLIDGIYRMMYSTKDKFYGPINLGNNFEITIDGLAREIVSITNSKSKILYKELPQDDPRRRKPNIDFANNKLNWYPKVALDEGLKRTIEYFKTCI